jgi:hypothetical protein
MEFQEISINCHILKVINNWRQIFEKGKLKENDSYCPQVVFWRVCLEGSAMSNFGENLWSEMTVIED